jgi:nucleotide-binding universal stress UspA family protein
MFKRILIPTDGSAVANKAVRAGIRFAKEVGARVVGYYAVEVIHPRVYGDGYVIDEKLIAEFDRRAKHVGEKHLAAMANLARSARVRFESVCAKAVTPHEGIIATARRKRCDAIFIASHGRSGLARLVMGSVTSRVLANSRVPVVVYR